MKTRKHRKAFTWTEVLIVLGMIIVFAALLFPAVKAARDSARSQGTKENPVIITHYASPTITNIYHATNLSYTTGYVRFEDLKGQEIQLYGSIEVRRPNQPAEQVTPTAERE